MKILKCAARAVGVLNRVRKFSFVCGCVCLFAIVCVCLHVYVSAVTNVFECELARVYGLYIPRDIIRNFPPRRKCRRRRRQNSYTHKILGVGGRASRAGDAIAGGRRGAGNYLHPARTPPLYGHTARGGWWRGW